jgi:hypothetical protein
VGRKDKKHGSKAERGSRPPSVEHFKEDEMKKAFDQMSEPEVLAKFEQMLVSKNFVPWICP